MENTLKKAWLSFNGWLYRQINENKAIRRLVLLNALILINLVVWRLTTPEALQDMSAAGAALGGSIITLLTSLPALYQYMRNQDDNNGK